MQLSCINERVAVTQEVFFPVKPPQVAPFTMGVRGGSTHFTHFALELFMKIISASIVCFVLAMAGVSVAATHGDVLFTNHDGGHADFANHDGGHADFANHDGGHADFANHDGGHADLMNHDAGH